MWKYSSFREKLAMIYVCAYPCQSTITVFHWQPAMVGSGTRFQVEGDQPRAWKAGYRGWLQVAQGNWGELTIDVWFSFSIAQELRRSCSILLLDVDLLWDRCILMNEIKWRPMARGCLGKVIQNSENNPPSSSAERPMARQSHMQQLFQWLMQWRFPFLLGNILNLIIYLI